MDKTQTPTDYVTRKDLEEVVGTIVGTAVSGAVGELANIIGEHFVRLEGRVDRLENRMDGLEGRMDSIESTVNRIERKLDNTIERTDNHSTLLEYNLKIGRLKHKPA